MTAAEPDWLDLRRPVDDAARQESLHLLDDAVARLSNGTEPNPKTLLAIDIGAGTGNSALWFDAALRARLPDWELNWILLDSDQASLDLAATALPHARTICAPISALPTLSTELLAASEFRESKLLLTCSALLDVLTEADLTAVVRSLDDHDGIGLFLLSIVDGWELDPDHPSDAVIDAAFTAHQHRDGRLGHHAPERLMDLARRHGLTAVEGPSPWRLAAPADRTFLNRFLSERLDAAVDEHPALSAVAQDWWTQRQEQLGSGLSVRVNHLDVLIDAVGRACGGETPTVRAITPPTGTKAT
ncbi:hypothetical protein SAMN04489752_2819 [Brevibacterium siliguriense]|uniref:Methyltransferase domain-containing protein n=1 Tax=Brevibacterium siliguriense TaxID=1136497 RepID=A0A1H1W2B6_9MICO|nr:hypothetical protein [Brevibacterium siliguriense]SDS90646.1 hypothetical protein SAMN04489752_2819 [Brevibacterium siliguriense]